MKYIYEYGRYYAAEDSVRVLKDSNANTTVVVPFGDTLNHENVDVHYYYTDEISNMPVSQ